MKVIQVIFLLMCVSGPLVAQCEILINKTGCGQTKGCYTCTDDKDECKTYEKYVLTFKKAGEYIEFEMSGKNQWVAVGFNDKPDSMIGTDAVMCVTLSGEVKIHHYDLTSKSLPPKTDPTPSQITLTNGTYNNGRTTCRFKRKIDAGGQGRLKNLNTPHYLVFAYGPVLGNEPSVHEWKTTTDKKVDVQEASKITGGSVIPSLIKAHGSLMTIAWLGFAAIAIFMARYMRLVWEDEKLLGQKVWFTVHRGLMTFVIIFSTLGIILAFVYRKGWSEGIGAHPYTGIITLGLAVIQPTMAFFRPHPGDEKRFIFNWAHRAVGLSAFILAVVTLFLAVFLKYLDLEKTGLPVLIVFCVGVAIVLIFEIFFCIQQAPKNQESFSTSDTGGKSKHYESVEQMQEVQPKSSLSSLGKFLRLVLFGFVLLWAIATSLVLVILIALK